MPEEDETIRGPVVIAGSSGLIGGALAESLLADGVPVVRLVRRPARGATGDGGPGISEVEWHPDTSPLDPEVIEGAAAVVSLGGASIGRLPWTRRYREELRGSRIAPTRTLAAAIRRLGSDAPQFVSASAVGIYGDRPGEALDERSGPGDTFLARLCLEWELEARQAGSAARVALLRTASVLHPRAVLKPLIPLTRLGLSGPLGGGEQSWPWISLTDEVRAIRHVIDRGITGPVNLCGPEAATANEIGRALARRLHRPYLLPAPSWALRLGLGREAADSLLLADARVTPRVLDSSGFVFTHRDATSALAAVLDG